MAFPDSDPNVRSHVESHVFVFAALLGILLITHLPFISLPFFWDELGQFIPASLDILHAGKLVPITTVPNVHPPGVMAFLALAWKLFGYSIPVTRAAMLTLAAAGVYASFVLAIRMCRHVPGAPALGVVLLMFATPLFYMQSMMAQLDMPAMVFTIIALVFFFDRRYILCAVACTALVLSKETGAILPAIFGAWLLFRERRWREASYFMLPFLLLSAWLVLLKSVTGYWLGDPGFAHYNVGYSLSPVRASLALLRRFWYIFAADFRWIGTIAIIYAWRRTKLFHTFEWMIAGVFFAAHMLLVSFFGGAVLERYLLPVFPIFYIAAVTGFAVFAQTWRRVAIVAMLLGMVAGLYWNPPYPFPLENNLAMVDFVELQKATAEYLEREHPNATVATAWPYTGALYNPDVLFVHRRMKIIETSDFHYKSVADAVAFKHPDVLVVYSRTWEPPYSFLRFQWVEDLLRNHYEYEPQITTEQVESLGMHPQFRFSQRGQWIEVYTK